MPGFPKHRFLALFLLLAFLVGAPGFAAINTEDHKQTGSLTAAWNGTPPATAGSTLLISAPAAAALAIQISGTWVGTVQFEGLIDEQNGAWFAVNASPIPSGSQVSSATANGAWIISMAGLRQLRVRCSAFTSGTILVYANASSAATGGSPAAAAGAASSVTVTNFPATQPVSAASLPLPTGAATETTLAAASAKLPAALVGGRLSVDGSGVTQPISATTLPLPTGAAADSSLTTISGKLPAALVGGRLDVNLGQMPGVISTVNSSTTPLGGAAVFTGTGEDVSGYAAIEVAVFSDVASAASGVSAQWSEDNTNWDFTSVGTLAAGVGQSFLFHPRAKFFRLVYTNGAGAQAAFRLQTIYHPVGLNGGVGVNAQQAQGAVPNGTSVVGSNSFILGVTDSSNLARYLLSSSAAIDATAGINSYNVGLFGYNGSTYDRIRTTPGATATTGTGVLGTGPLLWDNVGATNFVKQAGDGSGRAMVVGAAATGAAVTGNPVLVGGTDGTNAQAWLSTTTVPGFQRVATVFSGADSDNSSTTVGNLLDQVGTARNLMVDTKDFNGGGFDKHRNNIDAIIQASGVTTAQTINTDIITYNAAKILVHINVTLFNGGTLTVKLQWKDANGLFTDIPLLTTGALTSGTDFTLCLGANVWPANTASAFYANFPVPRQVRVVETIATASITFSSAYTTNVN